MNKKILELKVNNNKKDLEKYIKPQWSLKTLISIVVFVFVLIFSNGYKLAFDKSVWYFTTTYQNFI